MGSARSRLLCGFVVLATLFLTEATASAQAVNGRIAGIVRDQSGAIVPGATVVATNNDTGRATEGTTDEQGRYTLVNLPPGLYRVEARLEGFRPSIVERLTLQVLETATVDFSLSVGALTEQATVVAEVPVVQLQSSDLGRVVTSEEIESLPLNGRVYLQLATLTPGVNTFTSGSGLNLQRASTQFQGDAFLAGTQNVGTTISVGVQRERATTYRLDGINITSPLAGQSALLPSLESIQEFKVVTGNAPASIQSPASVNVVTKGGSNAYRGTAYYFLRDEALNARSFFDRVKPEQRVKQFGGAFGGRIIPNRTFFFGSYDGFRGETPRTTFATVPTLRERAGDFSGGAPITDPRTGLPFAGNRIPADRFSQYARVWLDNIPLPNLEGQGALNYSTLIDPRFENDQGSLRIDHEFSPSNRLFARYTQSNTFNRFPGIANGYGFIYPYDARNAVVSHTNAIGSRWLNEIKFGYTHSVLAQVQEGSNGPNLIQQMGLQNLGGGLDPYQFGLPTMIIVGYSVMGPFPFFNPRGGTQDLFELQNSVTYLRGAHTLQFGGTASYERFKSVNPTAPRGLFIFLGLATGNPMADFLTGYVFSAIADAGDSTQDIRQKGTELFLQDDWRVTDKLTLNLGLRYQYYTPPADALDGQSYFDMSQLRIVTTASGEVHNGIYNMPKADFAPRIGFAWTPWGEKTAIRGGFGTYFYPHVQSENVFLRNNPPSYTLYNVVNFVPATLEGFAPPPRQAPGPDTVAFTVDRDAKTARYYQWQASVERQLTRTSRATVSYVGSLGRHLHRRFNLNQAVTGTAPIQERRPFPQFGDIQQSENTAKSDYHALQLSFLKQYRNGFSLFASYEHATGYDDASSEGDPVLNGYDIGAEWGRSAYLVPKRARVSLIWDLPFGAGRRFLGDASGVVQQLLGGWQIGLIGLMQSGTPLTTTATINGHNTGGFGGYERANQTCSGELSNRDHLRWFDTSCFSDPPQNTFGNSKRGAILGPGIHNWDMTVVKSFTVGGRPATFQAQVFNLFNQVNWGRPDTNVTSATFGRISSALPGRNIQLGLQFRF